MFAKTDPALAQIFHIRIPPVCTTLLPLKLVNDDKLLMFKGALFVFIFCHICASVINGYNDG